MALIDCVCHGIAIMEGYYVIQAGSLVINVGARAVRSNNPGNLRPFQAGQTADPDRYRIFPTLADGWYALKAQIGLDLGQRGMTLTQFCAKYGPVGDNNDPASYAHFIAYHCSVDANSRLAIYFLIDRNTASQYHQNCYRGAGPFQQFDMRVSVAVLDGQCQNAFESLSGKN
jgi:hypothetical protein